MRVTDRSEAYASIAGLLGANEKSDKDNQANDRRDRIVAVTLKLLNLDHLKNQSRFIAETRSVKYNPAGNTLRAKLKSQE